MSNLELDPAETLCGTEDERARPALEIIEPRDVPLGGPRAMPVRRTLPSKQRSLVGAWCFADHYGPDDVSATGGMRVPPHPHTGLQTISWLFSGEVEHRDSAGHHALVRPGELNIMTAGRGINHSEYSTPPTTVLHGIQLWTALPGPFRRAKPGFERYVPPAVVLPDARGDGGTRDGAGGGSHSGSDDGPARLRVFLGELQGSASPVRTSSPLLGAELSLGAGAAVVRDRADAFEHAFPPDGGELELDGEPVVEAHLAYAAPGRSGVRLSNPGRSRIRVMILGGPPFREEITMWWNFVGRTHEEIAEFRSQWQAQIGAEEPTGPREGVHAAAHDGGPFGPVVEPTGGDGPLPAPALPSVRLRPRGGARDGRGTIAEPDRKDTMARQAPTDAAEQGVVSIVHDPQRHRYEVQVDDVTAGFTQYRLREGGAVIAFDHTEVGEDYAGLGLAGRLVSFALDDVRSQGQRVRPYCPYVRAFIRRHRDYQDLVVEGFEL